VTASSLLWVDWQLAGKRMRRESAVRFVALFLVSFCFLALLFSGGADRFLSRQWTVTAMLRSGVADEEGEGLAAKVAALPPVITAVYRNPQQAWEEFSARYPGLEPLRSGGSNPLPGYVEITMRHDRLSEDAMEEVLSVLRPLPQVETLLYGGEAMHRLFRWKTFANGILRGGFVFLLFLLFLGFLYQERGRTVLFGPDFMFLRDRGVAGGRIGAGRAAGAVVTALCLAVAACAGAAASLYWMSGRFHAVQVVVGSSGELLDPAWVGPIILYLLSVGAIAGVASLIGGRSTSPTEET
jgi:FtsX extracellular domain